MLCTQGSHQTARCRRTGGAQAQCRCEHTQPARAQAEGACAAKLRRVRRASPACCAGRCSSSTARRAYAHKCMAMRLSGGGPPLRCSRSSPRSHARCKGSHNTRCCVVRTQRFAALDGTPPGRGPGEVSARAGRNEWCTCRAACLRRAARSPRPCGAPFGCGFRARTWCGEGRGERKSKSTRLSEVAVQTGPQTVQTTCAVQKFARRRGVTVSRARGLFPPKSAQGG